MTCIICYKAFHIFGQALLDEIFATAPAAHKNDARFKSGQKCLRNNPSALLVV